jgi:mono/diheme cytochrome c family protein
MSVLSQEVLRVRMHGPLLSTEEVAALDRWLDAVPLPPASPPSDPSAVDRGRALFARAGCATCHGGASFTNNQTVDVGTGGKFQVPSLRGVAWRAPYMHDGCAPGLADRFGPCGGDDRHGVSRLSAQHRADLVAYLESL